MHLYETLLTWQRKCGLLHRSTAHSLVLRKYNDTNDGNVSITVTLICNTSTTLSADCPPGVSIITSGGTEYEADDVLTCSVDGINPSYEWSGTNGGSSFSGTSSTVTLVEGEFCLQCTATLNSVTECSDCALLCGTAYSKC